MKNWFENNTNTITKQLTFSFMFASLALALTGVSLGVVGIPIQVGLLEASAVFTSYMCTFLFAIQKRSAYLVGVVTTFLWSLTFMFVFNMPGMALFNLYLVGSLIYGFWRWGPDDSSIPVTGWRGSSDYKVYAGLGAAITAALMLVGYTFGMQIPLADFLMVVGSGVAQFALDNKRRWNWYVWIAVNVVGLIYFYQEGYWFTFVQQIYFMGNAFYALSSKQWRVAQ